jgi:hypothetical protein
MRRRLIGTRLEAALYFVLAISLAAGALILSDVVIGVGAVLAALALFGALSALSRERRNDEEVDPET